MGRVFSFLSVVAVLAAGMYIYSRQMQSTSAPVGGNSPKAAISITGVKADLLGIAGAERRYFVAQGKYASLDELISSNYISLRRERPPYTYEVEASSSGFRVVATRAADDTSGAPSQVSCDENMEFQTSQ